MEQGESQVSEESVETEEQAIDTVDNEGSEVDNSIPDFSEMTDDEFVSYKGSLNKKSEEPEKSSEPVEKSEEKQEQNVEKNAEVRPPDAKKSYPPNQFEHINRLKGNLQNESKTISERMKAAEELHDKAFLEGDASMMRMALQERVKLESRVREIDKSVETLDKQMRYESVKSAISKSIPDLGARINAIAEMAIKTGEAPEAVSAFVADPYQQGAPTILYFDALAKMEEMKKSHADEIAKYKKQSEDMISGIKSAASRPPVIGNSGSGNGQKDFSSVKVGDIENMSDEELYALKDSLTRRK